MRILVTILVLNCLAIQAQVELAIQKGHSSAINHIEFSDNGEYLISVGGNNDAILWDLVQRKALTDFKLPEYHYVTGIKFIKGDEQIKLQSARITYFFDIKSDKLTSQIYDEDTVFRQKDEYFDPDGIHEVSLYKGGVRKGKTGKRFANYWLSVGYTKADFVAFDVDKKRDMIVGVAEDNVIYVQEYNTGARLTYLKGHNSPARDVCFSNDGKYFATAGDDRSIIVWNSETYEIEYRLHSNVFKKKTATFSKNGKQIYIGDELGIIYSVDFGVAFPVCQAQENPQSINNIIQGKYKGADGYYIGNSNNTVDFKMELNDEKPLVKFMFREHAFLHTKDLLLQNHLGFYQEPFGEVNKINFSPNKKQMVFTGYSDIPNVTHVDLTKKRSQHLYSPDDYRNWKQVKFNTDTSFISVHANSGTLFIWRKEKRKFYYKTDSLPFVVDDFQVINDSILWICSSELGQYKYNVNTHVYRRFSEQRGFQLLRVKDKIVINSLDHELIFYDAKSFEKIKSFKGHTAEITDINFHPERDIFVTSSDDGTVRLWNYGENEMLAALVPFKNNELVIVTADNYYLISKGAFEEIGFKYEGKFFYPDQFDLKYNRPDIVLERLGYTNDELIEAYKKAYEKRLKKMNFTEEALSTSFHLPTVEISNIAEVPHVVDNKSLTLNLEMSDSDVELDRYQVWINEVAIFGSSGISLKEENIKSKKVELPLVLGYGDNKIEISVLNIAGAESYKEVLNVVNTDGKERPDAYIVSIGVSEYKQKDYNLAYAAKDAIDMENLFVGNDYFGTVSTKTFTDDAVTLENLANIKMFLSQAEVDDLVMIFVAGHGVLDENFDYYFASHDIDFQHPAERGIPYEKIEELLDGIKALKKLLILDTCHSGELDKDDVEERENKGDEDPGDWEFRGVGVDVAYKEDPLGFANTNNLMKSLFTDLRRGTGATVISSSGGAELALESSKYQNGLFTYCLIDALNNNKADLNKDKSITISELQQYVTEEVRRLSNGLQVPTSRIQNKELDYRLW